jgi:hypothetical protein
MDTFKNPFPTLYRFIVLFDFAASAATLRAYGLKHRAREVWFALPRCGRHLVMVA